MGLSSFIRKDLYIVLTTYDSSSGSSSHQYTCKRQSAISVNIVSPSVEIRTLPFFETPDWHADATGAPCRNGPRGLIYTFSLALLSGGLQLAKQMTIPNAK